jgi:hypothetical protein
VAKLPCGKHRFYVKGASEILARECTRCIVVSKDSQGSAVVDQEIETAEIDGLAMDDVQRTIIFYGNQALRTVALCYRGFESWPPLGPCVGAHDEVCITVYVTDIETNAIFFGRHRLKISARKWYSLVSWPSRILSGQEFVMQWRNVAGRESASRCVPSF